MESFTLGRNRTSANNFEFDLDKAPKPGSRRAKREAERQAREARANADTGEFPAVKAAVAESTGAPAGDDSRFAPGAKKAAVASAPAFFAAAPASATPYAEKMNHRLVAQSAGEHTPRQGVSRRKKIWQGAGFASAGLLVIGMGLGFAVDPTHSTDLAAQAQAATVSETENVAPEAVSAALTGVSSDVSSDAATVTLTVTADGETSDITAAMGDTVAGALTKAGIELGERDEVSVPLNSRIEGPTAISIVRVTAESEIETYEIDYETERKDDPTLDKGTERVQTEGKKGEGSRTFEVLYRDGEEVSRALALETRTSEPVDEVILVGTKEEVVYAAPAPSQNQSRSSSSSSSAAPAPAPNVTPGTSRAIAADMVAARGWPSSEFSCLDKLWQRESNWNHLARNPSSGAYGIPQALPGNKMASAGADWQTNPATQISWGLSYISGRYGTPCGALNHSYARGWY